MYREEVVHTPLLGRKELREGVFPLKGEGSLRGILLVCIELYSLRCLYGIGCILRAVLEGDL
jgi:hypothetical protein